MPRWLEYQRLEDVQGAPINPKLHDAAGIRASIKRHGFVGGIDLDERTGRLIAGHGRIEEVLAMEAEGEEMPNGLVTDLDGRWMLPVIRGWASKDDEHAQTMLFASNMLVEAGGWDETARAEMLRRIADQDEEILRSVGMDRAGLNEILAGLANGGGAPDPDRPSLRDRFLVPPFDVLDARQGWWRDRKRQWLALGIRSELGRSSDQHSAGPTAAWITTSGQPGEDAVNNRSKRGKYTSRPEAHILRSDTGRDPAYYSKKRAVEARLGRELTTEEFDRDFYVAPDGNGGISDSGTSVFDPVLCELIYRWYSREGDLILDPFAGGSVRGIVAAMLGRRYLGYELSGEQIAANVEQAASIAGPAADVRYEEGDCRKLLPKIKAGTADAVLTCPPYLSLERYSDDPRDLSTMDTAAFSRAIEEAMSGCYRALRDDAFAIWVVGQVRLAGKGVRGQVDLRAVVGDAARAAGFGLHNALALVTPVGSLAVRSPRHFSASRVLGRSFQDVLVLLKGSAQGAVERLGPVEVADPTEFDPVLDEA